MIDNQVIDKQKRNTLKKLSVASIACAAMGASVPTMAEQAAKAVDAAKSGYSENIVQISVYTRVSSSANDLEVVIQNTGSESARITQMTPSQTVNRRGTFDFSSLFDNGELKLAAGQSVSVPMTPHAVILDASTTAKQRAQSLTDALRKSFSVITENEAFARVDIAETVRFV